MTDDLISRRDAIDALWEALYEYEDKTKKQFQESEDLDVEDWIEHRAFVQNMNDIDRQTIINLPSVQPEIIRCKDCKKWFATQNNENGDITKVFCVNGEHEPNWFCKDGERRDPCSSQDS